MLRHIVRTKIPTASTANCLINQCCPYVTEGDKPPTDKPKEIAKSSTQDDTSSLMKKVVNSLKSVPDADTDTYEYQCIPDNSDIVIIGGGAIGSSIAYWLRRRYCRDVNVHVIEKDPTYKKASTVLSVGGLRQQFSLKENIEMSLFGAEFLRNINDHLGIEGEPPIEINFHPYGYLMLASEQGAETLIENSRLQNSMGAKNTILLPQKLQKMFPWLNTDGIAAGCLGLEKEGWFDPWSLLCGLKKKAIDLGAKYLHAEAKGFKFRTNEGVMVEGPRGLEEHKIINKLTVQTPDGEEKDINVAMIIIAAGAFSAEITRMAGIGTGEGILSIPLPVEPRKRYVYCFHCNNGPGINTPLTIDPNGIYFRRESLGGNYICGRSPEECEEPPIDNLDVDYQYFEERIWPELAHRVKAFEDIKVKCSWAGYYEYNTFDENGIVSNHPYFRNMIMATGFSGHGIQQAPAVGRAVCELIIDGAFQTIDLSRLGFDRFIANEPMREVNIV